MEEQIGTLKETNERLNKKIDENRIKEQSSQDQQKKMESTSLFMFMEPGSTCPAPWEAAESMKRQADWHIRGNQP